jgi:hypothetical protein
LLTPGRLGRDTVLVALDKLGHKAVTAEQQANAVAADPFAAEHLRCPVGAALLNVQQLARDAKGQILDFTNFVYRPEFYELHLHMQIDRGNSMRAATNVRDRRPPADRFRSGASRGPASLRRRARAPQPQSR